MRLYSCDKSLLKSIPKDKLIYVVGKKGSQFYIAHFATDEKDLLKFTQVRVAQESLRSLTRKIHHGEKGINQIHLRFPELITNRASEISTHKDVCAALDNLEISYDVQVCTSQVNIEPCHDPQNSDGRDLIKFFLDNKELTETEIEKVSSYFRKFGSTMIEHDFVIITN